MRQELEGLFDRMQQARDIDDLQGHVHDLRDILEVEHIVYHSVNGSGQQYAALTYSPDWVDRYLEQDYSRIDPVVLGCFQRFMPVDWKRLDWSSRAAKEFLGEALGAGVGSQGFSVPIRGPAGQFALFTVNDRVDDDKWQGFRSRTLKDLLLIGHFFNQRALEIEDSAPKIPLAQLSPRETDALTLLGKGMSRGQASDFLKISEHTLRVYLESARFKLGASNTVHAVALALARGLIIL